MLKLLCMIGGGMHLLDRVIGSAVIQVVVVVVAVVVVVVVVVRIWGVKYSGSGGSKIVRKNSA